MRGTRRNVGWGRWALLGTILVLGALALGVRATRAAGDENSFSYSETGYATVDPAGVRRPNDERIVLALFDCLTAIDPATGEIVPAAATRWEEARDRKSWTFHLRTGAKWSNGSPVKASDFVAAWRRALDPFEPSPWTWLFRPLAGCAALTRGDQAMRALNAVAKGLQSLAAENPDGIPGKEIQDLVEGQGVRPFAEHLDDATVKRLLRWGNDNFPVEKAEAAVKALKKERRRLKHGVEDRFDAFGKTVGATAKDDRTLVVLLERPCPWLPRLVARAPFAPLHPSTVRGYATAFEPSELVSNGAYRLRGRGPKPRPGVPDPDSVVHLARNPAYDGPLKGGMDEILCYTDQGGEENLRRLGIGELQWMANPDPELRKEIEKLPGFATAPSGDVVILRLRCDRPPFDRRELRLALAYAIDRTELARALWPAAQPADRLVPPQVLGAGSGPRVPERSVKAAKAALKEAGVQGDKFPWVDLHYPERRGAEELTEPLLKMWDRALKVEMGLRIESTPDLAAVVRAGAYRIALDVVSGAVDDPEAYVALFRNDHPTGGQGWEDAAYETLVAAARDVDAFLAGDAVLPDDAPDVAALRTKTEVAKKGDAQARETLRLALLAAAERRLLDEAVVIPLVVLPRAWVTNPGVKGIGSPAAWKDPAFVGSVRTATR